MAIKKLTKGELRNTFKARMEALAARHNLRVEYGKWDEFEARFWQDGAKYHTSMIATDFEYPRYSYGRDRKEDDLPVKTFVVSGKFLPAKENTARNAASPWDARYTKTADFDKAFAALEETTRRDNPLEAVETAAFEAKSRWNCNDYERRHPGCGKGELYLLAEALDGRWPAPTGNDVDDVCLRREIEEHVKQRNRYVGAWMAVEIIDISRKVERATIEGEVYA